MYLTSVRIENFRIIANTEMNPYPGINLLLGANGAGKTSMIEALFVLCRGQSFRHREVRPWIRDGEKTSRLFVKSVNRSGEHRIGLEQARTGRRIKIDGREIERRSDLVKSLPLQLVTSTSHELIEKGPSGRRRFLDWGLFHVEHGFHQQSLLFKRLLNQRNAALRNRDPSFTAWDPALADVIDYIENQRFSFLPILCESVNQELEILQQNYVVDFVLRSNWEPMKGVLAAFTESRDADKIRGYTHIGPHRSIIEILISNVPAERRLSRGQQKALLYAMTIGLFVQIKEKTSEAPLILIDDLPAELDRPNRNAVIERLGKIAAQSFVSGIEFDAETMERAGKVFHVEHGTVIESV